MVPKSFPVSPILSDPHTVPDKKGTVKDTQLYIFHQIYPIPFIQ